MVRTRSPKSHYVRLASAFGISKYVGELAALVAPIDIVNAAIVFDPKRGSLTDAIEASHRTWQGNFAKDRFIFTHRNRSTITFLVEIRPIANCGQRKPRLNQPPNCNSGDSVGRLQYETF